MMSGTTMGLLLGIMLGVVNALMFARAANPLLKAWGVGSLVIAPVLGWVVGAYVFEGAL